ncbi:MAG: leucine-rich repeat domain-containing protein [Simkaniaceae bacterium]|nr:leucine-rich repeat domain-containing protein [Simkaniaceae bacterium]
MSNPIEADAISSFSAEVQQHILRYVGAPAVTSRVSRAWNEQTNAVVNHELQRIFYHLNSTQTLTYADLEVIKKIYKQTLQSVPKNIAPHFPHVSLERFIEAEKIRDSLTLWKSLPGGQTYVNQQTFDGLSLEEIRAQLSTWIDQNPDLKAITQLRLEDANLRYLPHEIRQLTNLQELYLNQNQLTALPPEIGQLTNLQELGLMQNQLTALPSEIGQLTNLTKLYLMQNRLTALPPEIGQLTNLQRLGLIQNQLTALPHEIGQLTNLQQLGLNQNQLTALPHEIGQLTNLQALGLSQNQLTALPETLASSNMTIRLSQFSINSIRASLLHHFFQLSPDQKHAVYGRIYDLAVNAGVHINSWDTQYGDLHVFDSEESLEAAMNFVTIERKNITKFASQVPCSLL